MAKKTKVLPGLNKDVIEGETAHGAVFTVYYYFNSKYESVEREKATRAIVHEYDEKERSVYREYLTMKDGNIVESATIPAEKKESAPKTEEDVQ